IDTAGAAALIVASISWSVASALSRKLVLPESKGMSSGAQMLAGGGLRALAAGGRGEFRGFRFASVSRETWFALAYMIVAGSILRFYTNGWVVHPQIRTKGAKQS